MATGKMHADEVRIDAELVRRLIAEQFPRWADLPIRAVQSTATVNAIYRLGDHLYARLPRVQEWAKDLDKEWHWLPKLAPRLSLRIPEPLGKGQPSSSYPFSWAIDGWIDGRPYSDEVVDDEQQQRTRALCPGPGYVQASWFVAVEESALASRLWLLL